MRRNEPKLIPYPTLPAHGGSTSPLLGSALDRRVDEMQLSLNMMGLRRHPSDGVDQLTSALLVCARPASFLTNCFVLTLVNPPPQSVADDNMLSLMARGNADSIASGQLTAGDRLGLRAVLAQMDAMSSRIRQVLAEDTSTPPPQPIKAEVSSPVTKESTPGFDDPRADKVDLSVLVTEPTPPSTVDHGEGAMDLD